MLEPCELCATFALVAGCRYMNDRRQKTVWFYIANRDSALTRDDVSARCDSSGRTFIELEGNVVSSRAVHTSDTVLDTLDLRFSRHSLRHASRDAGGER